MGLYVQGNNSSRRDLRRRSLDNQGFQGGVHDDGGKIDLGRDSVINPDDIQEILRQQRKDTATYKVRKTTNKLLHTHIALILVCVLSSLDAACVIGQIICDILIMSDSLHENKLLHEKATDVLFRLLPDRLNEAEHKSWNFEMVINFLENSVSHDNATVDPRGNETTGGPSNNDISQHSLPVLGTSIQEAVVGDSHGNRQKRAAGSSNDPHANHESHTVLEELTHIFHIGSMGILSILVLEIFFKVFAMWKHFLNHKLEVFDAFVVIVSWCLDVAFWEGIWARPGQEGATLLIFILPWRVVRIVNSFVLVIQEKDLVLLKVVKQRLRRALRREKESTAKLDRYRIEVRQLQGLCRKHGADDGAINACNPAGKRRRSSLFSSLSSLASVAFASAIGNQPEPEPVSSSSSSEDEEEEISVSKKVPWLDSVTSDMSNPVAFSLSPGSDETPATSGVDNEVFKYDDETIAKFQSEPDNSNKEKTMDRQEAFRLSLPVDAIEAEIYSSTNVHAK